MNKSDSEGSCRLCCTTSTCTRRPHPTLPPGAIRLLASRFVCLKGKFRLPQHSFYSQSCPSYPGEDLRICKQDSPQLREQRRALFGDNEIPVTFDKLPEIFFRLLMQPQSILSLQQLPMFICAGQPFMAFLMIIILMVTMGISAYSEAKNRKEIESILQAGRAEVVDVLVGGLFVKMFIMFNILEHTPPSSPALLLKSVIGNHPELFSTTLVPSPLCTVMSVLSPTNVGLSNVRRREDGHNCAKRTECHTTNLNNKN